jgi:hypothetical protein
MMKNSSCHRCNVPNETSKVVESAAGWVAFGSNVSSTVSTAEIVAAYTRSNGTAADETAGANHACVIPKAANPAITPMR